MRRYLASTSRSVLLVALSVSGALAAQAGTNWSRAFGINAGGQIVGQAQDKTVSPAPLFAVFWNAPGAVPVELQGLGGVQSQAVAINESGRVVGDETVEGGVRPVLWRRSH